MESRNPVFNAKTLQKIALSSTNENVGTMTVNGSVQKTGILFVLLTLTSILGWNLADTSMGIMLAFASLIINLVLAFVLIFKKQYAATLAPAYALIEGLAIGAISAWFNQSLPGIVFNALVLTFGILGLMLGLYHFQLIKVTEKLKTVIVSATLAIALTYVVDLLFGMFGHSVPFIHQNGTYGIIFSLVVVAIASANLLLDFDMIEKAAAQNAPKYMEWYSGFAVMVTMVWLYLELLRLLSKVSKR